MAGQLPRLEERSPIDALHQFRQRVVGQCGDTELWRAGRGHCRPVDLQPVAARGLQRDLAILLLPVSATLPDSLVLDAQLPGKFLLQSVAQQAADDADGA
jgi:hypothetical protein